MAGLLAEPDQGHLEPGLEPRPGREIFVRESASRGLDRLTFDL